MFIVGGLIALGIVALIGAFFLARGGKANGHTQKAANTSQERSRPVPSTPQPLPSPEKQFVEPQPFPLDWSNPDADTQGQLDELTEQVQILQAQARELEQRLQTVHSVLDRLNQLNNLDAPTRVFMSATSGPDARPN